EGMIVLRGLRRPPSFHEDRLRTVPDGHLVDVMAKGFGAMPAYAGQVSAPDRWAIAAYIRALQLSQHATLADVPGADRAALEGTPWRRSRTGGPRTRRSRACGASPGRSARRASPSVSSRPCATRRPGCRPI